METSPWSSPAYRRFWASETVSLFGAYVASVALPLTAIYAFDADSAAVGAINAAKFAPYLVVTLVAGVWVDRVRRRPVMISCRALSTVTLSVVVAAALTGSLSAWSMAAAAFLIGTLSVVDQLAYQAVLPQVVPPEQIFAANGALNASESVASVAGPALGGALTAIIAPPLVLLTNAVTFFVSTVTLLRTKVTEKPPEKADRRSLLHEIASGARLLRLNTFLFPLVIWAAGYNFAQAAILSVLLVWMTTTLGLGGLAVGAALGAGGLGALIGSGLAGRAESRFGLGRTLVLSAALAGFPLAATAVSDSPSVAVVAIGGALFLSGIGEAITNVLSLSIRQILIPTDVFGRTMGFIRLINWGSIPIGSLLGGILGTMIDQRWVLLGGGLLAAGVVGALTRARVTRLPRLDSDEARALWVGVPVAGA